MEQPTSYLVANTNYPILCLAELALDDIFILVAVISLRNWSLLRTACLSAGLLIGSLTYSL